MKSAELLPSKANLISTLIEDPIGRTSDVCKFVDMLNSLEGGFSIALDSKWGSGKTFFVRQTQLVLDAFNSHHHPGLNEQDIKMISSQADRFISKETDIQPQVTVYYDAWENDNALDPLVSLVYAITKRVGVDFDFQKDSDIQKLAKTAAAIVKFLTGKDAVALVESLESDDYLMSAREQLSLHELVSQFLDEAIKERGNRLIVFIDELDRCKPSYAVQLLERVKHYFSGENITFVFSLFSGALQHTIKQFYGNDFDATKYLDRFFDITMALPPIDTSKYLNTIAPRRGTGVFDDMRSLIVRYYHFEMREILRYYKLTSVAVEKQARDNRWVPPAEEPLDFCRFILVPIALALRITDYERYRRFIEGIDSSPLTDIVTEGVASHYCRQLLSPNEIYGPSTKDGLQSVKLADKLNEAYAALFSFDHSVYEEGEVSVGRFRFTPFILRRFHQIISGISNDAEYNL